MSAYIEFFIKGKDRFYPIASYCRNSEVYRVMSEGAPWEKVRALSVERLNTYRSFMLEDVMKEEKRINEQEHELQLIPTFNNSIEEKIDAIDSVKELIADKKEDIKAAKYVINFIDFLIDIINEVKYGEHEDLDPNSYLYYGIECWEPTVNDIVN